MSDEYSPIEFPGMTEQDRRDEGCLLDALVSGRPNRRRDVQILNDLPPVLGSLMGSSMQRTRQQHQESLDSSERGRRLNSNTRFLYHQTDQSGAESIIRYQTMLRGTSGLVGAGIYFAESAQETSRKARAHGVILSATVKLGRELDLHHGGTDMTFRQLQEHVGGPYDSVVIHRSSGNEYIVYNYDQVTNIHRVNI